jgi:hypothetical protein
MFVTYHPTPLAACLVLLVAGCEHAGPLEVMPRGPAFDTIQETIFDVNCALSGCHTGSSPQQGMNLSRGQSYSNIVNVPSQERPDLLRVSPNEPERSYLLKKIRGDPDIVGVRMPLGRPHLSDELIDLVRTWIEQGAESE